MAKKVMMISILSLSLNLSAMEITPSYHQEPIITNSAINLLGDGATFGFVATMILGYGFDNQAAQLIGIGGTGTSIIAKSLFNAIQVIRHWPATHETETHDN
jgi:hypothetical protein